MAKVAVAKVNVATVAQVAVLAHDTMVKIVLLQAVAEVWVTFLAH